MSSTNLLVSIDNPQPTNDDDARAEVPKEISLDYSDEEMFDVEDVSPKRKSAPRPTSSNTAAKSPNTFKPIEDLGVFEIFDNEAPPSPPANDNSTEEDESFLARLDQRPKVKRYRNPRVVDESASFVNSDDQQERRLERARRFKLDDAAATASQLIAMPDEDTIQKLYNLFGIETDKAHRVAKYRLDTIFLRGVDRMSTDEVFKYIGAYNPTYLEWIDDRSCNLVWDNAKLAAWGLLGSSKPLLRLEPKAAAPDAAEASASIIEGEEPVEVNTTQFTLPPGRWRVGRARLTSDELILMRFATVDDVKVRGAQRGSSYYRENGNPNFGGQVGIISRSRMMRKRGLGMDESEEREYGRSFFRNDRNPRDSRKEIEDRRRWALLRADSRRQIDHEPGELIEDDDEQMTANPAATTDSSDEELGSRKRPRMRMRADDEERRQQQRQQQRKKHRTGHSQHILEQDDLRNLLSKRERLTVTVSNNAAKPDLRSRLGTADFD